MTWQSRSTAALLYTFLCWCLLWPQAAARREFTIQDNNFMLDGKPVRILSSELHYCKTLSVCDRRVWLPGPCFTHVNYDFVSQSSKGVLGRPPFPGTSHGHECHSDYNPLELP